MERDPQSTHGAAIRRSLWLLIALALIGIAAYFWRGVGSFGNSSGGMTKEAFEKAKQRQTRPPLPGELILKNYGSASVRPQDDLTMLANALGNLALLVKGSDPYRLGANEEFAAALRGKNRTQLRFLPDEHKAFNARGQLVDRWNTPLFFHVIAHDRIDIRSAGPDGKMWTDDDIHRRYDGQFLKGRDLNPKSLFNDRQAGAAKH